MYAFYLILLGLSILSNSILIVILYRRSQKNPAIVSLLLFLLFANIWIIPKFLTNALDAQGPLFEFLSRASALGYVFTPAALLVFSVCYRMQYKIFRNFLFWLFLLVPSIVFLFLSWTSNLVGVHDFDLAVKYAWGYETPPGELFLMFVVWFLGLMGLSLVILTSYYYILQDKIKKKQTYFVILSIIGPFFIGGITNGILPALNIFIFPTGIVIGNIMPVIIAYAIYKYGLFVVTPQNVLSNIDYAIVVVDINGSIVHINPSAERILEVKENEVLDTQIKDILHVENNGKKHNQLMRLVRYALLKGKSRTFENYSVKDRKSRIHPYTVSITPIYLKQEIVGANILLRDTRNGEVNSRFKDDYLSTLAHELKTPITSIKMYNQLLLRQLNDRNDKKRLLVLKMDRQLVRIQRLIRDFYDLSVVQTGKLKIEKQYFGIDEFIGELVETMSVTYKNRKIKVEGTTGRIVYADKDKIEQVFINFITNAVRYSPANRKIQILLSTDSKFVTVGVRDKGVGIPAKYRKKIFERFYQIKKGKGNKTGLGIGLFIAKNIIKFHNGKIWVESKKGHGCTFYFSLPISKRGSGIFTKTSVKYQLSYH